MKKIDNLEMAKLLLDVRRRTIFDIAGSKPVTVAQLAEELNEKPSRLYYHVKLLEEAGLLELAETRQQGNLIEKWYKSVKQHAAFHLDPGLLSEHSEAIMSEVMRVLEPGMELLAAGMKDGNAGYEKHVELAISSKSQTGAEWLETHRRLADVLAKKADPGAGPAGNEPPPPPPSMSTEDLDKKGKYAYFILSYKIDDI